MDFLKQDEITSFGIHRRWSKKSPNFPHYLSTLPKSSTSNTLSNLSRLAWVTLNKLRTHLGRFRKTLHKWGFSANPLCSCNSGEDQTAVHIIEEQCSLFRPPAQPPKLADPIPTLRGWLEKTSLKVQKKKPYARPKQSVATRLNACSFCQCSSSIPLNILELLYLHIYINHI